MITCPSCGKRVGKTAAFCASCGTALGDTPAPTPAAEPDAPAPIGAGTPRWLGTDWPLALLCVLVFLAIAAGVGGIIGVGTALIAGGPSLDALLGLVAGAWVPFAGLGADVFVTANTGDGLVAWFSSGVAPTTTIALGALAWWVFRTALPRVAEDRDYTMAFVAKVAVLGAVAVAVLGTVGSLGDAEGSDLGGGFHLATETSSAEPALWALVLLTGVGMAVARGRLGRPAWLDRARWLQPLRAGVVAWVVTVLVLGLGTSIYGIVAADDAKEGFTGAVVAPIVLGNTGVGAQAFAVGASVETIESEGVQPFTRDVDLQLSLFEFDLPPTEDSDAAPIWLWPLLLVTPVMAFLAARRWFRRAELTDGGSVLLHTVGIAGGFAVGAWLGGVVAPFYAGGVVGEFDELDFVGRGAIARPAVGATVGLTLLWALGGALLAAIRYSRRNGIDLIASSSSGTTTAVDEPVEAPAE